MDSADYNFVDSPLYNLLLNGHNLKLPKGQVVDAFNSTNLNLIKNGYIKRYLITKEGVEGIQVIYGPDDIFPLTPVYKAVFNMDLYRGPETYYYEAITPLELYSISISELQTAIKNNKMIYNDLFYAAGERLNSYIHRLESMSLGVANKKVAYQLVYLAEVFGEEAENGIKIQLPLTHQTLAGILNLARETVTHMVNRLEERGLIQIEGRHIVVQDIEKLRHI